jgi:hypothetical protein
MNNGIHPTDRVYLTGDIVRLLRTSQITDHNPECAVCEIAHGGSPRCVARMKDDFVPAIEQS